jgi:hypothetical protein
MRYAGWHVGSRGNVELVPPIDEFVPAVPRAMLDAGDWQDIEALARDAAALNKN